MVIEHPFDNKLVRVHPRLTSSLLTSGQAFILSRDKTHWRTEDRGKTWHSFDMPLAPALVGRPLSFHSDPKKFGYILYQGTACDNSGGWGSRCYDEVSVCPPFIAIPSEQRSVSMVDEARPYPDSSIPSVSGRWMGVAFALKG